MIIRAYNIDQKAQGIFKFWLKSVQILPNIHRTERGFRSSPKETRSLFRCKFNDCVFQGHYDNGALERQSLHTSDGIAASLSFTEIRGAADKSLSLQGMKQATATKLGIYSTYSPRNSIHFLAPCSNVCKPLKKKFRILSVQTDLRGSNEFRVTRKMETFQLFFFSVPGTGGSPTGPFPENRVGNQDNGNPGRPVSSGLQVSREQGHCRAITGLPW